MHAWALWAVHLLLSLGVVIGYTMYYETLWRRGGRIARWGLPLSNAALAGFGMLCTVVYPDTQRFYLNIAFFALVIALLDEHVGWLGYLVRALELLAFIALSAVLPIAPTTWHWVLLGFVIGVVWLWFIRDYVLHHLWAALCLAIFAWAIYWQPQANAPVGPTLRVLLTFLILVAVHHWLWQVEHRRMQNRRRMQNAADHDRLTHALSYARFRQDLAHRMAAGPFGLVMFDVDFFKSVNDEYGHPAGDAVLQATAALVQNLCADQDTQLYRTGGEEFAVLCGPDVTLAPFAHQLWQAVRTHRFAVDAHALNLSVSVGATAGSAVEHTVLDVIRRADSNLYLSKRRGRDTVTIDGRTQMHSGVRELVRLFAYYTAPVVNLQTGVTAANVLATTRYDQHDGRWLEDVDAGFDVATLIEILRTNDALLPEQPVLRLTPAQFIDPDAIARLCAYSRTRPSGERLVLSLLERPLLADFRRASAQYHQAGIHVVLVINYFVSAQNARQVAAWLPYYDELEIDLHSLAMTFDDPQFAKSLQDWQARLQEAGKNLIVAGIDNRNDAATLRQLGIRYGRGRYFAEPTLPRM